MNQSNLILLNLFLISSFQNDASWAINSFESARVWMLGENNECTLYEFD